MILKVFPLVFICLLIADKMAGEKATHQSLQPTLTPSTLRRPNEFLQPPPPPSVPVSQRRAITRLRSIRNNVPPTSKSGSHISLPVTSNGRQTSPLPTGNDRPTASSSQNQMFKYPTPTVRLKGVSLGNTASPPFVISHTAGPAGNSMNTGTSLPTGKRMARWFFSAEIPDNTERKPGTNEILRPPPPPPRAHNVQPNKSPSVEQVASGAQHYQTVLPYRGHSQQSRHQGKGKECNPCNKVPWIPMPRAHGVSSYHGSSDSISVPAFSSSNQYVPPAPLPSQYESPSIASLPLQSPGTEYGAPLPPFQPPGDQYGPPQSPPLKTIDGHYDVVPPLANEYGPQEPPKDDYGPPPLPPQQIQSHYKPTPLLQNPTNNYGPPEPPKHFKTEYGPPPIPNQQYGSPPIPNQQYGPPSHPINAVRPPPHPNQQFGPPSHTISAEYGAPPDQYGLPPPPPHDTVKQPSSPQLAPSYLPAPPVFESETFKNEPHSSVPNYLIPPPSSTSTHHISQKPRETSGEGVIGSNTYDNVNPTKDSQIIESQHLVTSVSKDVGHTSSSSIHLVPDVSKNHASNGITWHNDEITRPPNAQLLPSGERYPIQGFNNRPQHNQNHDPNLEVIPSIQVADYLSSVEYPLQIVQSPYIDVTESSGQIFVTQINQNQNNHSPTSLQSSYKEDIIVGKPASEASKLNESIIKNYYNNTDSKGKNVIESHDQKQQQSTVKVTNTSAHNIGSSAVLNVPYSSDATKPFTGNGYFGSDNQIKPATEDHREGQSENVYSLRDVGKQTGSPGNTGHSTTTFDIQPSIQTSAEGNSLIHQINNAFQSYSSSSPPAPFQNTLQQSPSSSYILFQNFPQPPLSYLPADVLKQQLPPPTPFQNTFQPNPYLPQFQSQSQSSHLQIQSTPEPPTTSLEHALKLEAPSFFLSPPPQKNQEYNTVTNTPAPDYTFWTPTSNPYSSSLSPESVGSNWGIATTVAPQKPIKMSNQNVLTAFAEAAGLLPPPQQVAEHSNQSSKKTKQIQIIVPYTSSKELMQFKIQNENKPIFDTTGWLPVTGNEDNAKQQGRKVPSLQANCSDQSWQVDCKNTNSFSWQQQNDYHQHQESRTVTATAPVSQSVKEITEGYPAKSYSELQHIFATNIRDLLRGEEDLKKIPDSITLQRLQKNIDEWTALEYSKRKDLAKLNNTRNKDDVKKSTTATISFDTSLQHLLRPSKKIPDEYLTTTPSVFDDITQTENYIATAIPNFKKSRSTSTTTTTTTTTTTSSSLPPSPFYDHELSGSHTHALRIVTDSDNDKNSEQRKSTDNINVHETPLNHQRKGENHRWKIIESNYILPEAVAATTTKKTTSSITPTTTSPNEGVPITDVYPNSGHTTWDQLPLSISPFTNEKVYVVTPVTTWKPEITTSKPYQTSPYSSKSTSINDVFPFRNGPPSVHKLVASAPFSFKSPRFIIRPTPGSTVHRSFTVMSKEDEDNEDNVSWNEANSTTLEPVDLNEIEEYLDFNLNSTTKRNTTPMPTPSQNDLLLGLSNLPTYIPPNGTYVHTDSGHSKVVTVVNSATVPSPTTLKKQLKKQSTIATTKLFPVTTSKPPRATQVPLPQPRGGITRGGVRKLRPNRDSYMWQFPELAEHALGDEDAEAVQGAVVELKREKAS